jgi:hypothetical protein
VIRERAFRLLLLALVILVGGCSTGAGFRPPETLDSGTYEKVDRTVENGLMTRAASALGGLGLEEPFGAAYEFLAYKPQFFLGAGRGSADRQAMMDAVLPLFGGGLGPGEPPREVALGATGFLCAPYSHTGVPGTQGTGGLASIAAVCTWSDEETAGFGVGVAGPSVDDVVRLTAEARSRVTG